MARRGRRAISKGTALWACDADRDDGARPTSINNNNEMEEAIRDETITNNNTLPILSPAAGPLQTCDGRIAADLLMLLGGGGWCIT